MRRSASPSKATGSTPARSARRDNSSSVLKTPFKPLSGLESRRKPSQPAQASTSATGAQHPQTTPEPSSSTAARELRARSIAELQEEVADMQLVLNERLAIHNAARKAENLPEQQPEQIVAEYIALLTQYNKVKDSAQVIFDKIADIEQLPAKDIHARYGVGESESST
ncbi:uncharacterized protein UTRI_00851_B [Ustilago trichophora]|uniref:Swi5-domain-containing protein n=1 Tax=Ustilago trichophora TaxID=86804 RepID=A0A5C3DTG6_9BASI|nr:uncharacterized protein UTRI_00851_B [Ustilago trichophora]